MNKAPMLKIRDLSVDFTVRTGQVRVLDRINLTLAAGETLGLVGESGCGKSMTALAIMRLIAAPPGRISSGRIELDGKNLLALTEREMRDVRGNEVSMIFQEPMTALNPVFTVGNQISESIRRHQGLNRKEARVKAFEMLKAVGVPAAEKRLTQYPHELSGGLRQRVMIAMALSCRPRLLIADEPTTALDVTIQAQIFDLLLEMKQRMKNAIILITHDMGVIAENVQHVAIMYAGRKVEEGPVDRIIANPQHPYTQGLIACAPHLTDNPDPNRPALTEIPGIVPDLSQLGDGCPFAPRCTRAQAKCLANRPLETEIATGHRVSCWLAGVGL
jgi:peptide/nickel transport system ATP-binding protein